MELDPEARRILELAGRARSPDERDKARVEQRLALALGAAATAGVGVGVAQASQHALASKSLAGAWALKHVAIGALLLAGGTTAYLVLATRKAPAAVGAPAAVQAPAAVRPPRVARADVTIGPGPSVPAAASADGATDGPAGVRARAHPQRATADTLAAEVELLHRAQAAWRAHDALAALALLREHRAHHPRSELGLERDALQALVLCELGRKDEGARIGRGLLKSAPHSPLRASIEQSCALK